MKILPSIFTEYFRAHYLHTLTENSFVTAFALYVARIDEHSTPPTVLALVSSKNPLALYDR